MNQGTNDAKPLTPSEEKHNHNTVDPCTRKVNEKRKADTDRDEDKHEEGEEKHVAKKPKVCIRSHTWHEFQLKIIFYITQIIVANRYCNDFLFCFRSCH